MKGRRLSRPLLFLALLTVPLCRAQSIPSAGEIAARVDHHYNALKSLRVQFTEAYAGMGMQRTESGTLLLKKPALAQGGKMRWTYSHPAGKVFVVDGRYAWFYAPGNGQVQKLAASRLDDLRSPLRFLLGHTQLEKELANLTIAPQQHGFTLTGVPRGMEKRVASITLTTTSDGEIEAMVVEELDGARTSFSFTQEEPNIPVNAKEFEFVPPPGVPVVEGLPPV